MKKIIYAFLSILMICSIGAGYWLGNYVGSQKYSLVPVTPVRDNAVDFASPKSEIGLPVVLEIPSIDVLAHIEQVGADEQGRMGVPVEEFNVGWWKYGSRPGENGTAVIAGHVDTSTGGQGVFYELGELLIGDEIVIYDDQGDTYTYIVFDKQIYSQDEFPIGEIFGSYSIERLHLITCSGVFNNVIETYEDRLVIFAERIEKEIS